MQTVSIAKIVAFAIALGSASGGVALAQSSHDPRLERPNSELRHRAPIGARQPRPRDLPAHVLRDEGFATPSQKDFDKSLEICRDCGMHP
jgi:hypothetical protein